MLTSNTNAGAYLRRSLPTKSVEALVGASKSENRCFNFSNLKVAILRIGVQRNLIIANRGDTPLAKYNRNSGKAWTASDERQLRHLADQNTPTRVIGLKLGRTEDAVRSKASESNISLKPANQSPYNRQK